MRLEAQYTQTADSCLGRALMRVYSIPDMSLPAPATRLGMLGTLRSLLGGPGHRGPKTDHFDGERFFNPVGSTGRSFAEVRRWRRTSQPTPWPQWVENRARPALPTQLAAGEIALTFVNHITFLVQL